MTMTIFGAAAFATGAPAPPAPGTGVPHLKQNWAPSGREAPHFTQKTMGTPQSLRGAGRVQLGIAAPQFGQNFPVPATSWPHFGHFRGGGGAVDAPQLGQNLTPAGTGWPHFGHGAPVGAAGAGPSA